LLCVVVIVVVVVLVVVVVGVVVVVVAVVVAVRFTLQRFIIIIYFTKIMVAVQTERV